MKKIVNYLLVLLMTVSLIPVRIYAAVGNITIDGAEIEVGETKTLTIGLPAGIASADGTITSDDPTCVSVEAVTSPSGSGNYFMAITMTAAALADAGTVTIKGLKQCETTLTISDASIASQAEEEDTGLTFKSGTIKVGSATPGPGPGPTTGNANLSSINVSKGSLSPAFDKDTLTYTVNVENADDSIEITATAEDTTSTVTGTGTKSLSEGTNTIKVKVTATDGTEKEYTINVVRATSGGEEPTPQPPIDDDRSSDKDLKSLEVAGYSINPAFNPSTTSYSLEVENNVTSVNVSALPHDDKASVSIIGDSNLSVGVNNVNVIVTAEDGSQKIYTINVVRKGNGGSTPGEITQKSSENRLSRLSAAEGNLSPAFNPNTNSYSIVVASSVDKLDLTAIAMDSKAKVEIQGNEGFVIGETKVVLITVTAENGSQRTYTISVKKSDKDSDNKLKELTIPGVNLSPGFNPKTSSYTTKVGSGTNSITINATPDNENAKVEYSINGSKFSTNPTLDLQDGTNIVIVRVTDENGFAQLYTINVEKPSSSFTIFGIKIPKWLGYLLLFLILLLIGWLIFLLLRKKKEKEIEKTQSVPNIEIKPEFNFNSKNEDNDKVNDGGILNQDSSHASASSQDNDTDIPSQEVEQKEVPYDPYDEVVTKDEIIDAIKENDEDKLRLLYKQEMLNREKEELKKKEEER